MARRYRWVSPPEGLLQTLPQSFSRAVQHSHAACPRQLPQNFHIKRYAWGDYGKALQMGIAAGGATAFSDWLGSKEQTMELLGQGQIETQLPLGTEEISGYHQESPKPLKSRYVVLLSERPCVRIASGVPKQ